MVDKNEPQDVDLNNGADPEPEDGKEIGDKGGKGAEGERQQETDDARLTRLTRQVNQQRKKMGLDPLTEKQVEQRQESKAEPSDTLDNGQRALLRAMGIKGADEIQLAKDFLKRTGQDIDSLESDDIFQGKLEKLRTTKANEAAAETGNKRGNVGDSKESAEYWLAKLGPNDPVPADLPRALREKIVEARIGKNKTGKQFYND